ncbi:hypothetical protein PRIPAC_90346 [Pristionchus pacificus]|uniref:Uncharacterized protein n=1 Tax=Pristionchus pacificus TaxID=54126 RepID=A0A2A6B900_PRIPA|nr:hypothetical protein PRIPAC_90346 [Pristionchus pacificus]|eukprot:PDM62344.1 hypothetical protein PRIPAC_51786 [Pristionchus pacificus]
MFRMLILCVLFNGCIAELSWNSMNSPLLQQRLQQLLQVAGPLECVNTFVDDICDEFPELRPSKEDKVVALKREVNYFCTASTSHQNEALRGNSTKFPIISHKIKQLKRIAKRELANLTVKQRGMYEDEDHFITSQLITSMMRLYQRRVANHIERGLTKQLIQREIEETQLKLWDLWHGDRPQAELQEFFKMDDVQMKYEL